MDALGTALALAALAAWAAVTALGERTRRAVLRLDGPPPAEPLPPVTAVVPCRDEARGVERAIRSLLAQEPSSLRVVAVDDRSTDGTGRSSTGSRRRTPASR